MKRTLFFILIICFIFLLSNSISQEQKINYSKVTILKIQRELKNKGFYSASIDGFWGSKTEEALKLFQKDNGIKVTGILDSETRKYLSIQINEKDTTQIKKITIKVEKQIYDKMSSWIDKVVFYTPHKAVLLMLSDFPHYLTTPTLVYSHTHSFHMDIYLLSLLTLFYLHLRYFLFLINNELICILHCLLLRIQYLYTLCFDKKNRR